MLQGRYSVKMDSKGRFKLPATYRRSVEDNYGPEFFVTSVTGENARIYPIPVWADIQRRLQEAGTTDPSIQKFLDRTNYWGQPAQMDSQGRLLVHPLLRNEAQLVGDVEVFGYIKHFELWELDRFKATRIDSAPFTAEDVARIASLGI